MTTGEQTYTAAAGAINPTIATTYGIPGIGNAAGGVVLFGNLVSSGGAITLQGFSGGETALFLAAGGNPQTIDTTNGGTVAGGGNVTVNGTIDTYSPGYLNGTFPSLLSITAGTGGTVTFESAIGSGAALAPLIAQYGSSFTGVIGTLDVTAGSIVLPDAVTTSGGQTYNGAVRLPVSATLTDTGYGTSITFNGTVDDTIAGTASLTVDEFSPNAASQIVFQGAVGGIAPLGGLTVRESPDFNTEATVLGGNVTTQGGAIDIETGAIIAANVTLDTTAGNSQPLGANVTIAGSIDGDGISPRALTVKAGTGGTATLLGVGSDYIYGEIGQYTPLASLDVTGAAIFLTSVVTTGEQTYTAAAGTINPTISTSYGIPGTGNATGGIVLFGNLVSSGGAINLQGFSGGQTALFLAAGGNPQTIDTTNSGAVAGGANITVDGTIDTYGPGYINGTFPSLLSITAGTGGTVTFDGAIGSGAALAPLVTHYGSIYTGQLAGLDVTAKSIVLPAAVTTTTGFGSNGSGQTYNGAVRLPVSATLTDTGNATSITFNGTVDDTIAGTASLTVNLLSNAETFLSQVLFNGAVGGIAPLSRLTVQENPDFDTEAAWLGGNVTTQGGAINIETGAVIAANLTLDTTAGNSQPLGAGVTIAGSIDGDGAARALTVNAGTGGAAMLLDVGYDGTYGGIGLSTPLASLTVTGATIFVPDVTTTGAQTYTAGPAGTNPLIGSIGLGYGSITGGVALYGNLTSSGGAITFEGAGGSQTGVFVANDLSIDTNGGGTHGGNVTFIGTIDSYYPGFNSGIANTFSINAGTSGAVSFGGAVGAGAALAALIPDYGSSFTGKFQSVSVTGKTITLPSAVLTSSTQSYSGAATLGANTTLTASAVTFNGTLNDSVAGTESLTVSGKATFDNSVGGVAALSSLAVSGTTTLNLSGGTVATSGGQTYTGAVTLSSDAVLSAASGTVGFASTVNGAHNLTIAGNASFANTVGSSTNLTSLLVTGTDTLGSSASAFTTTGTQTYSGAVTLGATTTTMKGSTVTFDSTVNGAHALAVSGNASFGGVVGGSSALTTLSVTQATTINASAVTTSSTQTYTGAVTLAAATTLAGTTISFANTVNGADALTVSGNASFGGVVGGTANLASLLVTGTSSITTTAITTTGAQTYSGAVTLGSATANTATTLGSTSGGAVTFGSTINSAASKTNSLTVKTAGTTTFDGAVGGATNGQLGSLTVSNSTTTGATVFGIPGGGTIKTSGTQTYAGAVTLGTNTTLTGTTITFASTVDDQTAGTASLTVSGNASFGGVVGGAAALSSLDVTGTTALNGGAVTTTGTQTYAGAVTLGTNTTLTTTNSLVSLGNVSGSGDTLTISTGSGGVTFGGLTLAALSLTTTGTETLDTGSYNIAAGDTFGPVTTNGTLTFLGPALFTGQVLLGSNTTINGSANAVTFDGRVDGGFALAVNTTGLTAFELPVGGATALASLSVSGPLALGQGTSFMEITTGGNQSYGGAVTLFANTEFVPTGTSSSASFGSTIDSQSGGPAHNLIVFGSATFAGSLGNVVGLNTITTQNGSTTFNASSAAITVTTTGSGTSGYGNAIFVGSTTFIDNGGAFIQFNGTVNSGTVVGSPGSVTVTSNSSNPANADFTHSVGTSSALASLTVNGATTFSSGATQVITSGAQSYGATTVNAASTTFDSSAGNGGISFASLAGQSASDSVILKAGTGTVSISGVTSTLASLAVASAQRASFGGAVTIGTLNVTTGSGGVTFNGLSLSSLSVTTTGTETLDSGTYNIAGGDSFGGATTPVTLNGAVVLGAATSFNGAVTLGSDTMLSASGSSAISFNGALSGASKNLTVSDAGGTLTLTSGATSLGAFDSSGAGLTVFGGAVSATSIATGAVSVDGGSVTTSGFQSYGAATLGANTVVTDTANGAISFSSTLGGNGYNLTVANGGGTLTLASGATSLGAFDSTSAGLTVLDGTVTATSVATGAASVDGGSVTTSGFQTYGAVTLGANTVVTDSANGVISFRGTLGGNGYNLTVTNGSGTLTLASGATSLGAFDSTAAGLTVLDGAVTARSVDTGAVSLDGGSVTTSGFQTYGAATLGPNTVLIDTANGAISFTGALNGSSNNLTVSDAGGTLTFTSGATSLGTFDSSGVGQTVFGGAVTAASVTTEAARLDGGSIVTTGTQSFNGAVMLGSDTILSSTNSGAITFGSTIDGAFALTVNTAGATVFEGTVGGTTLLTSLTTDAPGTTSFAISGGQIRTSGAQTYNDAVTLAADTTLAAGTVSFGSTVDGAFNLDVVANARFGGAVGGNVDLTSLRVTGTATIDTAAITTTGTQSFNGAVTLGADTVLASTNSGAITFGNTVDGAHALTVNTAGATVFEGTVGGTTLLTSLTTDAPGTTTFAISGGQIRTTGAQTYNDAVALAADTTLAAGNVSFGSTVDGAFNLDVVANASFGGAVGGTVNLTSLRVTGTATIDTAVITTTGTQSFNGAVTLGADTVLSSTNSGAITFGSTIDGAHALTVNTAGATIFEGTVGGTTLLTSLTTDAAGSTTFALSSGQIGTTGAQTYNDAVTLAANTMLTGSAVTFGNTVDDQTAGSESLTVVGSANFDGPVGSNAPLSSLTVNGPTTFLLVGGLHPVLVNSGTVTTTGAQTYAGAVTLAMTNSFPPGNLTLTTSNSLVTLGSVNGAGETLTISTGSGGATFNGMILAALNVSTTGTETLDAGIYTIGSANVFGGAAIPVTLNGSITLGAPTTFNGAVTLGSNTTLTGSTVSFNNTVDDQATGSQSLTVSGNASFGGAVGSIAALSSLDVTGAGALNGGSITTTGAQTYSGAVTLGANDTLTSSGGGAITLASTVDGAFALTVNTAGTTTFGGVVGGTTALASLTTDAPGVTALNGGSIRTTGAQTYNHAVTLGANDTLSSTGGGAITLASTVDGAFALTLNTAGTTTFGGAVGGITALTSLTTDAPGTTALNGGSVTTTGNQTYSGAVTLGANDTLTSSGGGAITLSGTVDGAFALTVNTAGTTTFGGAVGGITALTSLTTDAPGTTALNGGSITTIGAQTYNGAVTLGANDTLISSGGGAITLASTVDGAFALTVNTAGTTTFGGAVGGIAALASLTTDAPGTTALNGGSITTTGAQTYDDAATLGANDTLTGSTIIFNNTVDDQTAGNQSLIVTGNASFGGAVGSSTPLASLDVTGTAALNAGNIITSGNQTYNGAVTLGADTSFSVNGTGSITFDSTVTGAGRAMNFNLTGANDLTFNGNVGNASAVLGAVTINGGRNVTIAPGVDVFVTSFAQTGGTGTDDFGETLHSGTSSVQTNSITGEIIGGATTFNASIIDAIVDVTSLTIVDATSVTLTGTVPGQGIVFIGTAPFGTFNGIGVSASTITVLNNPGNVADQSILQISEPIANSLAEPGVSLGVAGINPAAGPACNDQEQNCQVPGIPGAYPYANAFIQGQQL